MSIARFEAGFAVGGVPLEIRRHPRARRLKLRVDAARKVALLTLPPRYPLARARRWAEEQAGWIARQLDAAPSRRPIVPGGLIPFRGEEIVVLWSPDRPRAARLGGAGLELGGPPELVEGRVLRWLKAEARRQLTVRTEYYARAAGVMVSRVSIGDARTRWGSCSSSGAIRYNWRLILAPPDVLGATVAHEVAHRLHMNHSPDFHALVARLFGRAPKAERAWLRANGAALQLFGTSS